MRRYEPTIHTGSREDRIFGLMREWCEVGGGLMRMFATARERERIEGELLILGVEVYEGDEADAGWLVGRDVSKPHKPACGVRDLGMPTEHVVCVCDDYPWRVRRSGDHPVSGSAEAVPVATALTTRCGWVR